MEDELTDTPLQDSMFLGECEYDIYSAVFTGDPDLVSSLCRQNLDIRNRGGWTPLMYGASRQHVQVVEVLLKNGASAVYPSGKGLTPIMIASRNSSWELVDLLLQHTPSSTESIEISDDKGWTALFHAVYMGQEDIVKYLIDKGANLNTEDKNKHTVFDIAKSMNHEMGTKILSFLEATVAFTRVPNNTWTDGFRLPDNKSLLLIFKSLNIEKYWKIFDDQGINVNKFVTLTEDDIMSFGIRLLGPRRKIVAAIAALNEIHHGRKKT